MLNPHEKAYLQALQALRDKQYQQAAGHFDRAAEFFANNQEFRLLRETTHLLLEVKRELAATDGKTNESLIAEELVIDGKETDLHGQGAEEEVRVVLSDLRGGNPAD